MNKELEIDIFDDRLVVSNVGELIPPLTKENLGTISVRRNPEITRKDLAERLNISENGVKFQLNNLKKKQILERIGPDKGGYWKILKT